MESIDVAIIGLGTVGTGVARLLIENADPITRSAGRQLRLRRVVVRDLAKSRDIDLTEGLLTDDLSTVLDDDNIKVVAQLIGGLEPARQIMLELLRSGKDVVTANKALLAEHGAELFDEARRLGRCISFEAAVAGGVPIVSSLSHCFSANRILSLRGILNGTSNFILGEMEEKDQDYSTALSKAQSLGYAEADPAMDVDGTDAVQKLAILAHLAFGARVDWKKIPCIGIDRIETADLRFARELGFHIKLLALAQLTDQGLELHVSPTLVCIGTPLAEVRKAYNAISVVGDTVGRVFFHGLGAGQKPTASSVVADLVDTVVGRSAVTFQSLKLWSSQEENIILRDHNNVPGRFYLRFMVHDDPGTLAKMTGVLGSHGISIASVIQHEAEEVGAGPDIVPLVFMTHTATEGATLAAVSEIDKLNIVRSPSVRMRVLD